MYKIGKCFETMYHYQHEAGCTIIQHIYKVQKRSQVFDVAKNDYIQNPPKCAVQSRRR
jgi:hypothetical protein